MPISASLPKPSPSGKARTGSSPINRAQSQPPPRGEERAESGPSPPARPCDPSPRSAAGMARQAENQAPLSQPASQPGSSGRSPALPLRELPHFPAAELRPAGALIGGGGAAQDTPPPRLPPAPTHPLPRQGRWESCGGGCGLSAAAAAAAAATGCARLAFESPRGRGERTTKPIVHSPGGVRVAGVRGRGTRREGGRSEEVFLPAYPYPTHSRLAWVPAMRPRSALSG